MKQVALFALFFTMSLGFSQSQTVIIQDDFEGNGTINSWYGDDCGLNTNFTNPVQIGMNGSAKVLKYDDQGGQYANIRFDLDNNFDLSFYNTFLLMVYVPSNSLTGSQTNQISLKLQDGNIQEPWSTQSEIIKPISLDQWVVVTFDFENDTYVNFDAGSPAPNQRTDFNRVLVQLNGENNTDQAIAYIDNFNYDGEVLPGPVFNQLIWSDEFESEGAINSENWFQQTQLPNGVSWYNGELQHYTDRIENSFVEGGVLKIAAIKEPFTDQGQTKEYTSARLNSKITYKYGRIEIRAKLPFGQGTWPAIWTLGKNIAEPGAYWYNEGFGTTSWPACGEIDIMEHWGSNQNFVQSATHTPSSYGGTINHGGQNISTASSEFHVYAMEWTEEKLVFSVDDVVHYTYNPPVKNSSTWPFDEEQYLVLNIAIAGGISPYFVQSSLQIDYVRLYQESSLATEQIDSYQELMVYPNPIDDEFNLRLDEDIRGRGHFSIYNFDGKLIETRVEQVFGNTITLKNLKHLTQGTYIILCNINKQQYTFKVFKN